MSRRLIHLWIAFHEIFYAASWRIMLWLAGGEKELNRAFKAHFDKRYGIGWAFDDDNFTRACHGLPPLPEEELKA